MFPYITFIIFCCLSAILHTYIYPIIHFQSAFLQRFLSRNPRVRFSLFSPNFLAYPQNIFSQKLCSENIPKNNNNLNMYLNSLNENESSKGLTELKCVKPLL